MAGQAGAAYLSFCGMMRPGIFILPLGGMLVHRRISSSINFPGTHVDTWVERGTLRVKCLVLFYHLLLSLLYYNEMFYMTKSLLYGQKK